MKKPQKITPQKIWDEYLKGEDYHQQIGLHEIVKRNEKFYEGEQWEGVNAPDLEKPVINVFKRAVTYLGSQVIGSDVGIHLEPFGKSGEISELCDILNTEILRAVEITKAKTSVRESILHFSSFLLVNISFITSFLFSKHTIPHKVNPRITNEKRDIIVSTSIIT